MDQPPDLELVLHGTASWVREVQQILEREGVRAYTGPVPSACGTKAWLAVAKTDLSRARAAYDSHLDRMLQTEAERRAVQSVADLDAPETICPACEAKFATAGVDRCPECGLNFGSG